jgi:hypothetical protein
LLAALFGLSSSDRMSDLSLAPWDRFLDEKPEEGDE